MSEIVVYGTDPCPRSTDDEVVVCARKPEAERYRIPERYRQGGSRQSRQSWANRAIAFETYGRTGINSCSPVGPGGFTGCTQQLINQAFKERREEAERSAGRVSRRIASAAKQSTLDCFVAFAPRNAVRTFRRDPGVDLRFERVERHRIPAPAPRHGSGGGRIWRPAPFRPWPAARGSSARPACRPAPGPGLEM